jgi:very-short-patch-repair endonuclease
MDQEISLDLAISRVAARQHGNVTRSRVLALGGDDYAIYHRVRTGRLHRVYPGVYGVGRLPKTALERASAAVLACGEEAMLSGISGLALWGFTKRWPRFPEVTVTGDRRPKGITVHRSRTLTRQDIRRHQGIPVTSPARTILDCAPRLTDVQLTRVVNEALLSGHLRRSHLAELLVRCPSARLLPFVDTTAGPTRSEFEDTFKRFCKRFGLPQPQFNVKVCGYEVDAYFEPEKVIVELDGWQFHSSRASFENDRRRDANTLAHGIVTVRITWARLMREPQAEAARLLKILQARRA